MRTSEFDFDLPGDLVAHRPLVPRDAARLLVVGGQKLSDHFIKELPALVRPGDLLVYNNTRVIPTRLRGRREGAAVEVTLVRALSPRRWSALARSSKRLRVGEEITFSKDLTAEVQGRSEWGHLFLSFNLSGARLSSIIKDIGEVPLPPYITRQREPDKRDVSDYQTVYAARDGAVAAPTAGLHFTRKLLQRIDSVGAQRAFVTLHVGPGTFVPVRCDDISLHQMQPEWGEITNRTAELINRTREHGGRIIAVGTTSLRLIESAADRKGIVKPFSGETDLFITPGYKFRLVDILFTNFHLPRSTLFMLVSAFSGLGVIREAYSHAMKQGYRFYSYGDACFLKRQD
tara:strand:+ start:43 stop:1077 length:1035 start_codon:yes stop_codon:yes gene_type:complete